MSWPATLGLNAGFASVHVARWHKQLLARDETDTKDFQIEAGSDELKLVG